MNRRQTSPSLRRLGRTQRVPHRDHYRHHCTDWQIPDERAASHSDRPQSFSVCVHRLNLNIWARYRSSVGGRRHIGRCDGAAFSRPVISCVAISASFFLACQLCGQMTPPLQWQCPKYPTAPGYQSCITRCRRNAVRCHMGLLWIPNSSPAMLVFTGQDCHTSDLFIFQ